MNLTILRPVQWLVNISVLAAQRSLSKTIKFIGVQIGNVWCFHHTLRFDSVSYLVTLVNKTRLWAMTP